MRIFVGLELPDEVREQLGTLERGIPGARWLDTAQLHLTLAFIGEVHATVARDIADALAGLRCSAFDVEIVGVGHFGPLRQARAVWAGIAPNEPLLHLQRGVVRRIAQAEVTLERRRFRPHVTLARMRGSPGGHHLANFLAEHSLLRLPPWQAQSFALIESHLRAEGAAYETLARYTLQRKRPSEGARAGRCAPGSRNQPLEQPVQGFPHRHGA